MSGPRVIDGGVPVPVTKAAALDPGFLGEALGKTVVAVETVEVIRTVATKIRFEASFDDGTRGAFCLKGFLDLDPAMARGGATMVLEADFYRSVAPSLDLRVPTCVAVVVARGDDPQGVVLMRDLIAEGARFGIALEAFTVDEAAASLGQLACLHAAGGLLADRPWIAPRLVGLANAGYVTPASLQALLDDPRGDGLPADVRDAARLIASVKALAAADAEGPQTLIHGDAHAGNLFRTADGPGLIDWQLLQRGGWALDVAYHLAATLDVAVAEAEERRLLDGYLEHARGLGVAVPDRETAWHEYRRALVYGLYLWGITRRVDPPIIVECTQRLGRAVARHDSYRLLGV